ncbi:MAG: hypothetical protein IT379_16840 [Deltaproteobacteria bacterium]|nr:hypothetical protein [Deltaproteobacteria bacterium]
MSDSDGGSTGGVEDARPSFWQTVAAHQAEIASGAWSEVVDYVPGGGGATKQLTVLVDRSVPEGENGIRTQRVRLTVPLQQEPGLTIVEEGYDRVDVPLVYGATPTRFRVTRVITRDPSVWFLEASA